MADIKLVKDLEGKALEIRVKLLELCEQHIIHIGGDLSLTDLMTVIWQYSINYDTKNPKWENRDRFVLSKGHAAAVTSFCQAMKGCYTYKEIFDEYNTDNGRFAMHSCNLMNPYVDVSTGSLGHGLPVATGIAQGLRLKGNKNSKVYVVMGDGEMNEGSMWEAAAIAYHYKLGNIIGFVDCNGFSYDGTTKEVLDMGNLADKFRLFGWYAYEVDGHDIGKLVDIVDELPPADGKIPIVIVANTIKGCGVDFMEHNAAWHGGKIDTEVSKKAIDVLMAAYNRKWGE